MVVLVVKLFVVENIINIQSHCFQSRSHPIKPNIKYSFNENGGHDEFQENTKDLEMMADNLQPGQMHCESCFGK